MADSILDADKYDTATIEFLEIVGAFFVSRVYNSIYQHARVAHQKDSSHSLFETIENYIMIYLNRLNSDAGVSTEVHALHKHYNTETGRHLSFDQFVLELSQIFVPNHAQSSLQDSRTRVNKVTKLLQTVVPKFYSVIITNYVTHIHNERKNAAIHRQIQDHFMKIVLIYRFTEHEQIIQGRTGNPHAINDKLVGELTESLNQAKARIQALETERDKFKSLIILQNSIIQKTKEELEELRNRTTTPMITEEPDEVHISPARPTVVEEQPEEPQAVEQVASLEEFDFEDL